MPPLPSWVPADVAQLVADLTARDPVARPAHAAEVAERAEHVPAAPAPATAEAGFGTARATVRLRPPAPARDAPRRTARPAARRGPRRAARTALPVGAIATAGLVAWELATTPGPGPAHQPSAAPAASSPAAAPPLGSSPSAPGGRSRGRAPVADRGRGEAPAAASAGRSGGLRARSGACTGRRAGQTAASGAGQTAASGAGQAVGARASPAWPGDRLSFSVPGVPALPGRARRRAGARTGPARRRHASRSARQTGAQP